MIKRKDGRWQEQIKLPGWRSPNAFYSKTQREVQRNLATWSMEREQEQAHETGSKSGTRNGDKRAEQAGLVPVPCSLFQPGPDRNNSLVPLVPCSVFLVPPKGTAQTVGAQGFSVLLYQ